MLTHLRHIIRANPTMYWLWLHARFGYSHKLPDRRTDLHIDGFQRSGNTFSTTLLRNTFPDKKIVSHFHAIASLKLAIRYGVPIIVVIRDPAEAIASSIVKRVQGMGQPHARSVAYDLEGYTSYYRFVLKHRNKIDVVVFEDFIRNPFLVVSAGARLMSVDCPSPEDMDRARKDVLKYLESDDRPAANNTLGSPEKTALKVNALAEISGTRQFREAKETYQAVCKAYRESAD